MQQIRTQAACLRLCGKLFCFYTVCKVIFMDTPGWNLLCSRFSQKVVLRMISLGLSGTLTRQYPPEVKAVLAGFLQFPAGVDPTQIAVDQYLEQHPWIRRRFSPFGRIHFIQFPYSSSSRWALSRRTGAFYGIIISEFSASSS